MLSLKIAVSQLLFISSLAMAQAAHTVFGTLNGSLHLTHTSPAPIPGLLAGMEEELRKACAI
jgi:hypothetical protein